MKRWILDNPPTLMIVEDEEVNGRVGRVIFTEPFSSGYSYDLYSNNKKHRKIIEKIKRKGILYKYDSLTYTKIKIYSKIRYKIWRKIWRKI